MMRKFKIKLTPRPQDCSVEMDGEEVADVVEVVVMHDLGDAPLVQLTLRASEVEIEADATIAVKEAPGD